MKNILLVLCISLLPVSALAQFFGLPIADGALPATGETRVSAGVALSDDFSLYGGRLLFAPFKGLALFADGGVLDPDQGDWGFAAQAGGKFTLPLPEDRPVDVALRATFGFAGFDTQHGDVEATGYTIGAVASREVKLFTPFAFLGLSSVNSEVDIKGAGKDSKDELDLALAGGVVLRLTDQFSLYGELAHVDELFMNAGARWTF